MSRKKTRQFFGKPHRTKIKLSFTQLNDNFKSDIEYYFTFVTRQSDGTVQTSLQCTIGIQIS